MKSELQKSDEALKQFNHFVFDILLKVKDIVIQHNLMHIATTDEQGLPKVRGVDYASAEDESIFS